MKSDKYRFDGSSKLSIKKMPTDSKNDDIDKESIVKQFNENFTAMEELQNRFYADGREGLVIIFQALDAAGKDSTIRHVATGFNPQGVYVYDFKQPGSEELRHDYLWRVNKALPARGDIAIFNRSYYEDVLAVSIHDIWKSYKMPERVLKKSKKAFFADRYEQITNYEKYLYENGIRVLKIFLNVSKDEQKKRFLERIDRPDKNWKFQASDLSDRALFDKYLVTIEKVINKTASKICPWYVVPADQKWYTRFLVSEIIRSALEDISPKYPTLPKEAMEELAASKKRLLDEE